jgi:hypothetical protein
MAPMLPIAIGIAAILVAAVVMIAASCLVRLLGASRPGAR